MIRKGVDMAMRLMGEQFVTGETIAEALANASKFEAKGFRYSYDMLGEAALTEHDAQKYLASYEQAIHAIGKASHGRGIYEGPGISIKLSALHPRYSRAQYERVMDELYPRLLSLTLLAKQYDIGLNIDAEEADRLELSLDLLERLCFEPSLAGWNGIGFVIQAYQKRCPYVIDYVIDLAAQPPPPDDPPGQGRVLGQRDQARPGRRPGRLPGLHPQGVHRRVLHRLRPQAAGVPEAIYPQFATHNAHTLSAIYTSPGRTIPGPVRVPVPARHGRTAVRAGGRQGGRRQAEPSVPRVRTGRHPRNPAGLPGAPPAGKRRQHLVRQPHRRPVDLDPGTGGRPGGQHRAMGTRKAASACRTRASRCRDLYGSERANSAGIDGQRTPPGVAVLRPAGHRPQRLESRALLACAASEQAAVPVLNPADHRDVVGHVQEATVADVDNAIQCALNAAPIWPPRRRARRDPGTRRRPDGSRDPAADGPAGARSRQDLRQRHRRSARSGGLPALLRGAGAQRLRNDSHRPLGPVVCISPWNFPLAIFTGQVAAALAAGNPVWPSPPNRPR
jgi:RHH-type proline utilization regulon transcriptional repressor/proline dehydrogenase/delta 1-pyrroline-5-carboxylate dehydrogenase